MGRLGGMRGEGWRACNGKGRALRAFGPTERLRDDFLRFEILLWRSRLC